MECITTQFNVLRSGWEIFICIFPFSNAVHFSAMCREEVGGGVVERGLGKVFCSLEGNMAQMMRMMLMIRVLGMIKFLQQIPL